MTINTDLHLFKNLIRSSQIIEADYALSNNLDLIVQGTVNDDLLIAAITDYQKSVDGTLSDLIIANLEEAAAVTARQFYIFDDHITRRIHDDNRGFFSNLIDKAAGKVRAIYDNVKLKYFTKEPPKNTIAEVSDTAIADIIAKLETNRLDIINAIADERIAKKTTTSQWADATIAELKLLHTQAFTLGRGGLNNMTVYDKARLEKLLTDEIAYFSVMAKDLSDGKLSIAQLKSRLGAYGDKARGYYEEGRYRTALANNYLVERRVRRTLESCEPCLTYAARGWVIIGTLPNPTFECDCNSRCKCVKEYSKDLDLLQA